MLEVPKPCFSETHPHILELRNAIEQAHKLRSDNTDPNVLVSQTERNIANKQRIIEKAQGKVAELRAQRCDIDRAIAEEEARIHYETGLLDTFIKRLEEANARKKATGTQSGILPQFLDKVPGQPTLREWIRLSFPEAHSVYAATGWETPVIREQADLFAQWRAALGTVNGFASYAATRTVVQIEQSEATEARKGLEVIARMHKTRELVMGQAKRACEMYTDGGGSTVVPFSVECPILQEWCQTHTPQFAAITPANARSLSSPYWKPEKPDGPS